MLHIFKAARRFCLLFSLFLVLSPTAAYAIAVGDPVINPATGATETVVQVLDDGAVFTDQDNAILTRVAIGDKYTFDGTEYEIDAVTTNPSGRITSISLKEVGGAGTTTRDTLTAFTVPGGGTAGTTPGNPGGPVTVPIPSGNVNVVHDYRLGPRGSDGRNGYGVELCIGIGKFKKCFIAGRSGHSGDPGGNGPTIVRTVTVGNNGNIQTVTPGLSGVTVISQGGDGGDGGDSFGSLPPLNGGAAGLGGTVIVDSSVDISTSGERAHGIFAQSRGGKGGDGGGGYVFSGAGAGGPASAGGSVTAINRGKILTTGNHAVGLFAQSIGGGGGAGGDSYGLVGDANSGSVGGNGGRVVATNSGNIETRGLNSHGIQAQSIGGTGGNTGNAGGIVALGGTADNAGGGTGGSILVNNLAGGTILTKGHGAAGIFAQSVGGGGGSGGVTIGIVAFGSKASRGGNGGTVEVRTQAGSSIQTEGISGHGIFAQSIGGGGGTGGTAGGFAALGGDGNTAGNGGQILVENHGLVITRHAEAKGIFAQSIGGGGGSASGTGGLVALGGKGGAGGNGNTVNVTNTGGVQTSGIGGDAVFAQSIGGGGGSGAASGGLVALGGSGTQGGAGSTVNVQNSGALTTLGPRARGILAQSIGGGGGSGGDSGGAVTIGGSGGVASNGGTVIAGNSGQIQTSGNVSHGIQLQSIGGGGGDGGSTGGIVSIGGRGGAGGNGGVVAATNSGSIATQGNDSNGIFAQSVGGGGGNGGNSVAAGVFVSVGVGGEAGNGGAGGTTTVNLGPRTVIINGTPTQVDPLITTQGDRSNGILAQSVGGGGGNGGFTTSVAAGAFGAVSVGIGGRGGNGGNGGAVGVNGNGAITTMGVNSDGVLAQSVGGGGGNGGMVTSVALSAGKGGSVSAALGIGGSGGSGGVGGRVQIRSGGSITTDGVMSDGLIAQSVGGGGGNGGHVLSLSGAASDKAAVGVSVGIGGTGGNGGSAGEVDANYTGNVTTKQADSTAVLLQAVGGGGGNGGYNVSGAVAGAGAAAGAATVGVGGSGGGGGHGGVVTGIISGSLRTEADRSAGVVAQSVGGGGGNGGFNVSGSLAGSKTGAGSVAVGVGGSGGGGGVGSTVNLTVNGTTTTSGQDSAGIVAQSVGGGGGNGGFNVSGAIAATYGGTAAGTVSVGVGGAGGSGGSGGRVISSVTGLVSTDGKGSTGALSQSLGGGGGNGGFNVAGGLAILSQTSGTVNVGVGGFGGGGGTGGNVDFHRTGNTVTTGVLADAIVGQSVGGGGGNGGINISGGIAATKTGTTAAVNIGIGGFGGNGGAAGNVKGRVTGDVIATGLKVGANLSPAMAALQLPQGSNGVVAQSIGGGGGNGGINVSGGVSLSKSIGGSNYALTLGLGGFGGAGGNAGMVDLVVLAEKTVVAGTVVPQGVVSVKGAGKSAVLAQSVGGGGGNGAINISGGIAMDGSITAGVGGSGGAAGRGNNVVAAVTGEVMAAGVRSRGFVAQSVGGGGGDGSINISGGIQKDKESANPSLTFGLGGAGGGANASGTVAATQMGSVVATGVDSIGILAQSVAGGGGSGGLNVSADLAKGTGYAATIGIGGNGGAGANSNMVTLTSNGTVAVDGTRNSNNPFGSAPLASLGSNFADHANGILVQSIGGGGGSGGVNVAGALSKAGSPLAAGVGGTGGAGGNAGAVLVNRGQTTQALLQTTGNHANALTAQSIGGGGGDAGINVVLAASGGAPGKQSMIVAVGGSGGAAGNASTVTVNQKGEIKTTGTQSVGLLAQSIGGGGGNASYNLGVGLNKDTLALNVAVGGGTGNGGTGSNVTVDHTGNITTDGLGASALIAQSIGGGGGNAALSLAVNLKTSKSATISIGRTGGTGGAAGVVNVAANGIFTTSGDMASAIIAQSVGNGGGLSTSTTVSAESQSGDGATERTNAAQLSVGLEGGSGGTGGKVIVKATGTISTNGKASHGIHAQSIGGGGGVGGFVTTLAYQESGTAKVGVGGSGGSGAKSDTVDVTSTADVTTAKEDSHGIYAQSVGGAGGTGGKVTTIALLTGGAAQNGSNTATVAVGGSGGSGAEAEKVNVASSGKIETKADRSAGIVAQSIGGGGGDGGLVISQTNAGRQDSNALNVGVGGSGGNGGLSRAVTVENADSIKTAGKQSYGIQALSVGGGGGNASLIVNDISKRAVGTSTNRLEINVGGSGGTGGSSGDVAVANKQAARVDTSGEGAHGIFAQSIGGGGGNGSSIFTQNDTVGRVAILAGVSIGGSGGSGSKAGKVSVTNNGAIQTSGNAAHGIFAQSIGGGGGNGGASVTKNSVLAQNPANVTALVSVGGKGGSGEDAGDVIVTNTGTIRTEGKNSHGILAQSIGGGGGNASLGLNAAAGASAPATTLIANKLTTLVGGSGGGSGGMGGRVTVNHSGDITVIGEGSQAIKAQSINGGGGGLIQNLSGVAGVSAGSILPIGGGVSTTTTHPVVENNVGGKGTENTSAGAVTINTTGTFGLTGNHNTGSSIQSIGGGGGTALTQLVIAQADGQTVAPIEVRSTLGGENGKNNRGADIAGGHSGGLVALGANTHGVLLQTIGGGGGRSTFTVDATDGDIGPATLKIGATNGSSETGGAITYRIDGAITIAGNQSIGVLTQSIGGGGGIQTFDTTPPSSSAVTSLAAAPLATGFASAAATAAAPVNLVLGANGGAGNHGGAVNLTRVGDTVVSGDNASAIVHQSIGAGGGIEHVSAGPAALNIQLGGQSGANGNGDAVTLTNTGNVMTTGSRSHGIFLQSIGGGGGAVFHDADIGQVSHTLNAANSGNGGAVKLVQTGDVMTGGKESFGIVMQSIGGGGGFIDGVFAGTAGGNGTGATVELTLDGSVVTSHETSTAILAQSAGTGGGDISIAVKAGRLVSGGANGVGIDLRGGAANTITNEGTITTATLTKGLAISGTTGNETVDNTGLVSGSVKLAGGTNRFNNAVDTARFHTGGTVDLGLAINQLFNNGIVQPGDTGKIETVLTTELGGTYIQTPTANYEADLDFVSGNTLVGNIDRINATGSAQLDGTFDLFIVNPNAAAPGTHEVTFFTTQQDMTSQNLTLNAPPSAVAMYDILYPSLQEAKFEYVIDFSPVGLNGNQTSFGDYINNVQLAGGSSVFADLVGTLFVIPTLDGLKVAYDSLSPEPYADNLATTVTSIENFSDAMMSCRDDNGDYGLAQRNCVWAQAAVVEQDYSGNTSHFAYNEESHIFAMGFLGDVTQKLYLGLAGSFEKTSFNSGNNAWGKGERPQAGVVLEYRDGATMLAGSLVGGVGHFDTTRVVDVGTVGGVTTAKQRIGFVSTNVRWSHFLDYGNRYLMPSVDGSAIYMHQRAFTETGGGLTNLTVDMSSQMYWSIAPSIEAGGDFDLGTSVLRAKAKIGVLQHIGEVPAVEASLVGTPAGVPTFTTTAGQDRTLLTVSAGLDWILDNGINLRASVGGQFGKDTTNKQGSLKLTVPF